MWLTIVLVVLALHLTGLGAAVVWGALRWHRATTTLVTGLERACAGEREAPFDAREVDGLPDPVARYFRTTLRGGQPLPALARLAQEGAFRLGESDEGWRRFHATQVLGGRAPGFVWDARIAALPGARMRARDSYVGGAAAMRAEWLGLFTIVEARNTPALDAAALQRYLAEAMWLPTSLLPRRGVRWAPIDDASARATLADGPTSVALDFRFGPVGEIASVFTPARFREVRGAFVPTPWEGRCLAHGERGGMRIPLEVEVAWVVDGRRRPYWRGRVTEVTYVDAG